MEKLKIMPEYECFSFWLGKNGLLENVDPSSLGISAPLASDIDAWENEYEATYVPDDPARSGFPSPDVEEIFNQRGLALAARVKRELGALWTVVYRDTLTGQESVV